MSTPSESALPDYNHVASDFDRFLPLIEPVAGVVLARLPALAAGQTVLDVACGTGEPGLTLARRNPQARLLGVDSAAAMIAIAQGKAARAGLRNARFEVMSSDALTLADRSVDAVISRFGLLLFGDVPASARELGRVLRPGGSFSLAVWDDMEKNTLVHTMMRVLGGHLPKEHKSPLDALQQWAADGVRLRLLNDAGLGVVESEMFSWPYRFESFAAVWDLLSLMGHFTGSSALPKDAQQTVQAELLASLAAYRQADGVYLIPHACRLIWGQR
jgi:ubiquinone/menaquinone biosynthesis C-methylase UbiE